MGLTADRKKKCQFTWDVEDIQKWADQRGDPTILARRAKNISGILSQYNGWSDTGWKTPFSCGYSTSRNLQTQLGALLLSGMSRMTRTEAISETKRETGIRTAVDTAGSTTHQALAEDVRQATRPPPTLITQATDVIGAAVTQTGPPPKIPPEPVRVDFTNRVKYLEGQRRSFSTDKMITSARQQLALLVKTPIWNESCGFFSFGCKGKYDSSISLNKRLNALVFEAKKKQMSLASDAEKAAAAKKASAERAAISAASQERIAAAQVVGAKTEADRRAAEARRVSALQRQQDAESEVDRQRRAQQLEMRRRRQQQTQADSSITGKEFKQVATGIASILAPLSKLSVQMFSMQSQSSLDRRRAKLPPGQIAQPRLMPEEEEEEEDNTMLYVGVALGGMALVGIVLLVALSGGDEAEPATPARRKRKKRK